MSVLGFCVIPFPKVMIIGLEIVVRCDSGLKVQAFMQIVMSTLSRSPALCSYSSLTCSEQEAKFGN